MLNACCVCTRKGSKPIDVFHKDYILTSHSCTMLLIQCFDMQEVKAVCRVLAAILHLGNIDLAETESEHRDTVSFVANAALLDIGEIIIIIV